MTASDEPVLNLLLFTVGGLRFGCDADQASAIASHQGEAAEDLHWFHEEMGFGRAAAYRAPMAVTVKSAAKPYRVIIDSLDQIAEFSSRRIRLLPALIEPLALRKGIWGILVDQGQIVLLVDFLLLLKHKNSELP
jgi:hypothetical protein